MTTQAIFLSYASQDADAARRICEALREAGLEVWFDQSELRGGDAWDASIRKQIKECALFVPMISAATNARSEGYFRLEWKLAVDRSHLMADDQLFFVPVILDDTPEPGARVPDAFRTRQWSRLKDENAIAAFAARVVKLIAASVPSGINASSGAPVLAKSESFETVAPAPDYGIREQAPVGAQVAASSQGNENLDPGLRRDDSFGSLAATGRDDNVDNIASVAPAGRATDAARVARPRPWRIAVIAGVATCLAVALALGGMAFDRERRARLISENLARITELVRKAQFTEAFLAAQEITRAGGLEKLTPSLQDDYSRAVIVTSTPTGAKLELRAYHPQKSDGAWLDMGIAPASNLRVPRGAMEWRATLPDGAAHVLVSSATPNKQMAFFPIREGGQDADGGMVPVPEGTISLGTIVGLQVANNVKLAAYSIDRLEVRNRDFARFVAAGGYTREEYWQDGFTDGAKKLAFAEAMSRFKDATGRPGPALWKLGNYPEGEGDLPVRGVSWYEAAAYVRFAGKALPSVYHWYRADTGGEWFYLEAALLPSANFSSKGPRASANSRNIGAFGALDMAGNVREWVATRTDKGESIAIGGSWLEVDYHYRYGNRLSPWERPADVGFRCMSRWDAAANSIAAATVREGRVRDSALLKPVSEAEYAIYTRLFEKSRVPLDARVEADGTAGAASSPYWTRTKVSYATGYSGGDGGGDKNTRMNAYLYLPKNAKPPYQTVVFMPGSGVMDINKPFEQVGEKPEGNWAVPEMIIRGGRAVLYPIWNGSFERHTKSANSDQTRRFLRDRLLQWVAEMQRSVDYLHTRSDIDTARIGYFGYSLGAMWAPNMFAMEPRVSAAVLLAGGLEGPLKDGDFLPPELDSATYAPRVKAAVAMINGRSDLRFPFETSQVPLFKLLGSPPGKKIHKTFPGGHSTLGLFDDVTRETHDWFDKQFGPISTGAPADRAAVERR